jgi:hypothetical protein
MIRIDLTPREADILDTVCRDYLMDLRMEIAGTDRMEFRENLKQQEVFLKDLLKTLEARTPKREAGTGEEWPISH